MIVTCRLRIRYLILFHPPPSAAVFAVVVCQREEVPQGEVRVHIFQHGSGGVAKRMPTLSLILPPLLRSSIQINAEALRYGPWPINPLTAMVLSRQIQEPAGSEEG